jgi:dethiobiotin synthetase
VTLQPSPAARHGFFVTGTDTGVGKTLVACALLHAFAQRGEKTAGMKAVAAGAQRAGERLVNDDVTALVAASTVAAPPELVNPYCFAPPIAPHLAAAECGVEIDLARIAAAYRALAARADCVVVEGAGGFRVPLSPGKDTADLASLLGLPVILVVGMRLGCINHALLTVAAIEAAGLPLAGWVANHIDPGMMRPAENVATLDERIRAPRVAMLPYRARCDAATLASLIEIDRLCASA